MKFFSSSAMALLAVCVLVTSCGKKPSSTDHPLSEKSPEPAKDPLGIRLGFFASMTGAQASFGTDALHGAQLAVEEINAGGGVLGHPVELLVKDTQSQIAQTARVVNQLISEDKVAALIGEIATNRSLAAAPIAQKHGVPMITPGSTNEKVTAVGDCIFRVCYTDSFQAGVMSRFARSLGATKAAILYDPGNPYSAGLAKIFKKDFTARDGTIVAEEFYRAGDTDFSTQLAAIKTRRPDVIFLPSYYAEAALIIRQAREAGMKMPFLGTDGWDSPEFLKVGGAAVNNCYFSSHFSPVSKDPAVRDFVDAYRTKYGEPPPPLAALTYDAIFLTADAIKRAGSTDPAALRDALAATADFPGVTGTISLDQNRNPRKPGVVLRVEDEKFTYLETIEPADER